MPAIADGRAVVLTERGDGTFVAAWTIAIGTDGDAAPVWSFWTCTWAVPGTAILPPWTEPERVVELTTEVASRLPFQRMTVFGLKFAPTTFMVTVLEPAAIVWGWIALMLGALIASTTVPPQPTSERQKASATPRRIAINVLKINLYVTN